MATDPKSESPPPDPEPAPGPGKPARRWVAVAVFTLAVLLLVLHRCDRELPPVNPPLLPTKGQGVPETLPPPPLVDTPPLPPRPIPKPVPVPAPVANPKSRPDSAPPPYLYADPWGGRHFDSVQVSLHCREGCVVVYSLEDTVHYKSYDAPLTFRRNTTLRISGLDSLGRQLPPVTIDYIIERNPGNCREGNMPVTLAANLAAAGSGARTVCMDVQEWPNREGEFPRAFVAWQEAADSCKAAGKRLCSAEEWKAGCQGPDASAYPYGTRYNENHCPAKEASSSRSGRFPACRSYYGLFDMTGNLWEWTSTPGGSDKDFYLVAGGNWNAGGEARCGLSKFSFYPSVRYPFVGFRCCREATAP